MRHHHGLKRAADRRAAHWLRGRRARRQGRPLVVERAGATCGLFFVLERFAQGFIRARGLVDGGNFFFAQRMQRADRKC
jgi:hypothetical protein